MDVLNIDFDLPFEEAIKWGEDRVSVLPADYYGVFQEQARARAFTVSGLTAINQIQDALDGLTKVLKDGVTFDEWRKTIVQDPQMLALGKARLETIFRTNIQTNYSVGRTQQQRENVANRPFLMYDAINDARTRPNHMALDNFIAPASDPIWSKITPPNGFNSILPWQRVTGNFSMALKAFYSGKICEVRCRSGISFSVTAQHPILTDSGWVDAANLRVGSNLLRYSGEVYSGSASTNPNKNYLPFTIKEIFDALASGGTCAMPRASFNLNGDVRFFDGDVDVVCTDWKLSAGLKPDISQLREQIDLISSNMNKCLASCESGSDIISLGSLSDIADSLHALAQSGFSLSFDKHGALIKFDPVVLHKDRYSLSVDFVDSLKFPECGPLFILLHDAFRDRLPTFALLYSSSRPTNDRTYLGFGALRDAGVCNVFVGGFAVNTNAHRDVFDCHPGNIELDDVVDLVTRDYSGHVYDLESKSGFIVVQSPDSKMQQSGVLVSNCRCSVISLTEAQAVKRGWKGFTEYRDKGEPDKGWDYNPADSQDARLDKIKADRLAKANLPDFMSKGGKVTPMKIEIDPAVAASLSKNDGDARAYVLGNGRKTGNEYLYAYDAVSGKVLATHTDGIKNSVGAPEYLKEALNDRARKIVVHHNHPNSLPPSIADVLSIGSFRGLDWAYVHGHDGTFYRISPRQRGNIEKATEAIGEAAALASRATEFAVLSDSDYTLLVSLSRLNALSKIGFIEISSNVVLSKGPLAEKIDKMTEIMVTAALRATNQD